MNEYTITLKVRTPQEYGIDFNEATIINALDNYCFIIELELLVQDIKITGGSID